MGPCRALRCSEQGHSKRRLPPPGKPLTFKRLMTRACLISLPALQRRTPARTWLMNPFLFPSTWACWGSWLFGAFGLLPAFARIPFPPFPRLTTATSFFLSPSPSAFSFLHPQQKQTATDTYKPTAFHSFLPAVPISSFPCDTTPHVFAFSLCQRPPFSPFLVFSFLVGESVDRLRHCDVCDT